jgi:cysteine desulfurase
LNTNLYLDYNSTSPLAQKVKDHLASGDFFLANPSSQHLLGKSQKKIIRDTSSYLKKTFNLNDYKLFFHSGATEGINTIIQGRLKYCLKEKKKFHFFYVKTDHSAVFSGNDWIESLGGRCHSVEVDSEGRVDSSALRSTLETLPEEDEKLINLTWVNNETGVISELDDFEDLKKLPNVSIHVDSVQSVGKIANWQSPPTFIDAFTYSAHKFGALKSTGFTFFKDDFKFEPLIYGGGQQSSLRSGTLNSLSTFSIQLALEELKDKTNLKEVQNLRDGIIDLLKENLADNVIIISEKVLRASNTINFAIKDKKADFLLTHFDMQGVAVSFGSACSSGTVDKSHVLLAQGHEDLANRSIRISLPFHSFDKSFILDKIKLCINTLK